MLDDLRHLIGLQPVSRSEIYSGCIPLITSSNALNHFYAVMAASEVFSV